jgi:hypothetical protein
MLSMLQDGIRLYHLVRSYLQKDKICLFSTHLLLNTNILLLHLLSPLLPRILELLDRHLLKYSLGQGLPLLQQATILLFRLKLVLPLDINLNTRQLIAFMLLTYLLCSLLTFYAPYLPKIAGKRC